MTETKTPEVRAFWQDYCHATGVMITAYTVITFGDSPHMRDELLELVLVGTKRATTSLRRDFTASNPLPQIGDHLIVTDGRDHPRCILRDSQIDIVAFGAVDAQYAWDEGEDDRSLAAWQAGHRTYFGRQAQHEGFPFDANTEVVLERFVVVWPRAAADQRPT